MKTVHYDVLILGGGSAGCSCALWLKHLGLKAVIVEKSDKLGGSQNYSPYPNVWILGRNYTSGKAFAREVTKQIEGENIPIRFNTSIFDLSFDEERKGFQAGLIQNKKKLFIEAKFIVLATGVFPRNGGFEPSSDVLIGPGDHIERADYTRKSVAILGGGDNAFENYLFIKKKKPKNIKIFARNVRAQLPFVKKIKKGDLRVGQYRVDIHEKTINGEGFDILVVMYGWQGVNPIQNMVPLKMLNGFVQTDEYRRTSQEGIYAVGEVTQASHPCCVTAMADGIIAAKDIQTRIDKIRVPIELKLK